MALFGKRQNDVEGGVLEKSPVKSQKGLGKGFKDLKAENKEKRKEPVKPWGRTERLIVFGVLATTVLSSGILAASARNWKLPRLPHITWPSLNIFSEETIVVERKKGITKDGQAIVAKVKEVTDKLSGIYGLHVIRLDDGTRYSLNENEVFKAASLIKLPVMVALYRESEKRNLDLDTKYYLKGVDKVAGAGSLYSKPVGYEVTYRDLLRLMGKESDNTAFTIARNLLSDKKITETMQELGMVKTSLETNETSLADIGNAFENLWQGGVLSEDNRDELFLFLTDTLYENWLADGLPDGIQLVHKYGREVHVVNDAGIAMTPKPYVIVILTNGVVEREADTTIPLISQIVFDAESK